jgi:hypothetical protein
VGYEYQDYGACGKKLRKTERPMTTALFMLRCVELGLSIADLDLLTIGSVNDMFLEKSRDSMEWREQATQADMDKF